MDGCSPAASTPGDAEAQGDGVRELNQRLKQATTVAAYQRIREDALQRGQRLDQLSPLHTAYQTIADLAQRHMIRIRRDHGAGD